ncbi:MAG: putative quinol monooxygenase [Atribacter sp.]|jgi:quinol monooxygenase YgiN|uniref:putative quinol monooxygenase n=1 Tax=Atribacter sp. TaxID=2847780 RepID=UPI003D95BB17
MQNANYIGDNKELVVLSLNHIREGSEEKAKEVMKKLVPLTNREPSCFFYQMHVNVGTEDNNYMVENQRFYMFYEIWRSRADWDKHMEMPYLQEWKSIAGDVCESWQLYIWERVKLPTCPIFRGGDLVDPKDKYTLLALVDVKEDCEDRAWKEMLALVPYTHTEPGCISYEMHINLDMDNMTVNPRKIMFYENWYDYRVWKHEHMKADYLVRWFDMSPQVTHKIELTGWKLVDHELTATGKEK